jgi:hypothetical protein
MVLSHPQYIEYEVLIDSKMVCLFFCFYQNVSIFKDQNKRSWGPASSCTEIYKREQAP